MLGTLKSLRFLDKKTHSASITLGPNAYNQEEGKKKSQKIIEMDCRGLEFTDFRADVSALSYFPRLMACCLPRYCLASSLF